MSNIDDYLFHTKYCTGTETGICNCGVIEAKQELSVLYSEVKMLKDMLDEMINEARLQDAFEDDEGVAILGRAMSMIRKG